MVELMYPKCPKCNEGTLLPFYQGSANIYACTKCHVKFGPIDKKGRVIAPYPINSPFGLDEHTY